jgi:hypothetical protein
VNWNELQFQPENEVVIASLSRKQLEAAPTFTDRQQRKVQTEIEQREREMVQQPGPGIVAQVNKRSRARFEFRTAHYFC